MNYNFEEYSFPSADGRHTIYAEIYTPKHVTARGVVQLAHGMVDHPGRYGNLIEFLTGRGYIFAGHHHLGHGRSVLSAEELGYFADEGAIDLLIADMHSMNKHLRATYPALPLVLLGHSMGSFITRLYAQKHPHSMQGVIIHGTGGPNKLAPLGKLVARAVALISGKRSRSKLIFSLAFGSYNKRCEASEGENAWLSRDGEAIADKVNDPLASFRFTTKGYMDLFDMVTRCNSREWFREYPKDMRTLVMSGDGDPVGDYGRGVRYVYKQLMMSGCTDLELRTYEGARHELFNETNRDEVFSDLGAWLDGTVL